MLRHAASVAFTAAFVFGAASVLPVPAVAQSSAPAAKPSADIPAATPLARLDAYRDDAMEIVRWSASRPDAQLRAHALEAVQHAPDLALPLVTLGLSDESPVVRFHALYTAGKLRLAALTNIFGEAFRDDDPRPSRDHVRSAVIFAAARCGVADDRTMSEMANLLQHPDPRVRANAAMLTGDLGNDTAIPLIKFATFRPKGDMSPGIAWQLLAVQAAEAKAKLGDPDGLAELRRSAYSNFDEVRIISVQALGRLGDDAFWTNFNNFLVENPVEFRLAAAESLARLDRDRGGMLTVMAEAANHPLATVRAQSAFALGQYNNDLARGYLARLLKDADPSVRISAAAAVLEATHR